ncbi:hypothetical protein C2845_PM01G39170 [Panicum miliaceum]|uniref:Uncharacterized protein n=1 Tax=Panicum miliaceum TaxID=4540 RepID=A0A3L6TQF4_PANMI|nr:hypothetical protein C2845_PM01G39170 [Panicum miliaceum]
MPVLDDPDRRRCSCLPFCFWGAKSAGAPARKKRRRRRLRLSWLAWQWFFRKGGNHKGAGGDGGGNKGKNKRRGRRLLLLLTASLQPKKALASVVSGGGGALLPAKFDSTGRPDGGAGGLWTAATTLGVIVLFGRVTAVVFLCSCLYGARFVRARAAGAVAKAKSSGVAGGSRQFGDAVGVAREKAVVEPRAAEEFKKKVVMAGLLDRAGKTPSSRFGR